MRLQLLVATMHQKDENICQRMNINSDCIVINQSNEFGYRKINDGRHTIELYTFAERGVGLSRNNALMRATADIVEFADDDMIFDDNHEELVINEFIKHPEADAILFSVNSLNPERPLVKINEFGRVTKIEALKYGCARLAIRREKLLYNNLSFSLLFGGGAKYGSGEDTVFLQDCIRAGLKIYRSTVKVADVKQESSTWFRGYDEKYYRDKGALFAAALPKMCYLYAAISAFKFKSSDIKKRHIFRYFLNGINEFKKEQRG